MSGLAFCGISVEVEGLMFIAVVLKELNHAFEAFTDGRTNRKVLLDELKAPHPDVAGFSPCSQRLFE